MSLASSSRDSDVPGGAGERRWRLRRLRMQLRRAYGAVADAQQPPPLSSGLVGLDALLNSGGLPRARLTLVAGPGGTSLLHHIVAATTSVGSVLWIDAAGSLFPPALAAAGADLAEIAVVRPRDRRQLARAVALTLRAGGFDLVVVDQPAAEPAFVRRLAQLARAATPSLPGRAPALLILTTPTPWASQIADLVLQISQRAWLETPIETAGQRLTLSIPRQRGGATGSTTLIDLRAPLPLPPLQPVLPTSLAQRPGMVDQEPDQRWHGTG